jgi:electron transfer flavoprotein alpha/beta subunit
MRIIVLIKPGAELEDSDACAVEHALRIARRRMDVQVTLVAAGPATCVSALRCALALGADDAVHVVNERISPHDALTLSRAYAEVVADLGFDLVVCGEPLLADMVSARLGVPVTRVPADSVMPPRHPSFPAITEARQKLISTRNLPIADPAITLRDLPSLSNTIINADGDPHAAAAQLIDFLAERRLV